jgi:pimeloyl-ACP methyl ester carboxylesterase
MHLAIPFALVFSTLVTTPVPPKPIGRLIDLGGHRLHINCTGKGSPTVVVENGLGDFSFDWALVQRKVERTTRICTYDRGGYAWSDPGPKPRTFAQLNLELHDALLRVGERGPFVLVGHSYGGGVVREYTRTYGADVAGLVFVDIVSESQIIPMGPKHAGRIGEDAKGREIPRPRETMAKAEAGGGRSETGRTTQATPPIEPPYDRLPAREQALHAWASALPALGDAEDSQREWSGEYFARWFAQSQAGSLGDRPLIVLTRAHGGYGDNLDTPGAEIERVRLESQRALVTLSTAGVQEIVDTGHNMHLEAPDTVAAAIGKVVDLVRKHSKRDTIAGGPRNTRNTRR